MNPLHTLCGSCRPPLLVSRRQAIGLMAGASLLFEIQVCAAARPIDESGFVQIGGIDQWIAVQGTDVGNPAILFLHGGAGEAQSPFLKEFIPWTQDFTVVNWDQRGSGKTYGKNGPATPGMSTPEVALDRMAEDAREVAKYVCKRLTKKRIILVGQSWGTTLGLHVIKRWPELFAAFVGTAQVPGSWKEELEAQERWARTQATAANDQATLKALDDAAALPVSDMRRIVAPRKYRWSASDLEYLQIPGAFLGKPPFPTKGDVADWIAGNGFSAARLPIFSFDARKEGLDLPIPFFVIQGRDDHVTSFEAARSYFAEVHAPKKAFIPIAGGHFACFTNPKEFVAALRRYAPLRAATRELKLTRRVLRESRTNRTVCNGQRMPPPARVRGRQIES